MADADATATVAETMEETKVIIESLVKRIGELADTIKRLRDENARLARMVESIRPYVKAEADASAAVAKNKK